ncbi:hypothetical protein ACTXT7_004812 [Hymenolepis weldensis]
MPLTTLLREHLGPGSDQTPEFAHVSIKLSPNRYEDAKVEIIRLCLLYKGVDAKNTLMLSSIS